MSKKHFYATGAAFGLFYALLLILLARLFLFFLSNLFGGIAAFTGMDEADILHISTVLAQLKNAQIASPWFTTLFIGTVTGTAFRALIRRCKQKKLITCCVWIPLLLPLTFLVLLGTEINNIRPATVLFGSANVNSYTAETTVSNGNAWHVGFGRRQIIPSENNDQPLYIAGYKNGVEISGVLDYCQARAVWMDTGSEGILLISVDCVALDSGTVAKIRENLTDLPNCAAINVYATHTHAGIDTLGLWGPVAVNGKNEAYMDALIHAAADAAREAAENRTAGTLYFGKTLTVDMHHDSRYPQVYDANLYQLRFSANNGTDGLRLLFYGAHAESLRSENTLLSRDFPGLLCDGVTAATGDNTMFLPGAIGGLIMTKAFTDTAANAEENMRITAEKLIRSTLSITEETEQPIPSTLAFCRKKTTIPMDNIGFLLYKTLGILTNQAVPTKSATGYGVETELAVLKLGELAIALLPGEIFPELVLGTQYGKAAPENENPASLNEIAAQNNATKLLVVGLVNDEIGYIVPPSDFLVHETMPYLKQPTDFNGENHYEETNSIGPKCAIVIAREFEAILKEIS